MTDEKILARIKKLLSLSTSNNENEAALAASKAQELLLEYNISNEELEGFSEYKSEKVTQVWAQGKNGHNASNWSIRLAGIVARANLCKILYSGSGIIWIGKPTNIEISQFLHETLQADLVRIAADHWALVKNLVHTHGKTWKNNFYYGACQAISERLNANLQQIKQATNDVSALIVRNDIELDEYMKQKYPRTTSRQVSTTFSRSAFDFGKSVGASIPFGKGVGAGGNSGPKLIGGGR